MQQTNGRKWPGRGPRSAMSLNVNTSTSTFVQPDSLSLSLPLSVPVAPSLSPSPPAVCLFVCLFSCCDVWRRNDVTDLCGGVIVCVSERRPFSS